MFLIDRVVQAEQTGGPSSSDDALAVLLEQFAPLRRQHVTTIGRLI